MIIEKITGKSYAEYVQGNIFDVCGMEHSSSMATGDVTSIPEFVPDGSSPESCVFAEYIQVFPICKNPISCCICSLVKNTKRCELQNG